MAEKAEMAEKGKQVFSPLCSLRPLRPLRLTFQQESSWHF
jgi:hypothetical protein